MTTTKRRSAPLSQLPPRKPPSLHLTAPSTSTPKDAAAPSVGATPTGTAPTPSVLSPTESQPTPPTPRDTMAKHLAEPPQDAAATTTQTVTKAAHTTGPELISQMIEFPTLDIVLDRDPHARPYSDQELEHLVQGERHRRALYQSKAEAKAMKKQGLEPTPNEENDNDESN